MKAFLELIRVKQWYKNLLVFLPIVFVGHLIFVDELLLTVLGFVSLCLVSSSAYIINDIADREKDKKHPEKKLRPIASGKIKAGTAITISMLLLITSLLVATMLSKLFLYSVLAIFLITGIYTFGLKKEPFADILAIAVNFVIRAASGAFIISVVISPWLILCTFFLSIFLSTGKRASDLSLLGKKAAMHRKVLNAYSPQVSSCLLIISTAALIISYSLFSFMGIHLFMILSLPFALYVIFRYLYFICSGSRIARQPEMAFKDKKLMLGIILWMVVIMLLIYI